MRWTNRALGTPALDEGTCVLDPLNRELTNSTDMPLVFIPDRSAFVLWGEPVTLPILPALVQDGSLDQADLVLPGGRQRIPAILLPLLPTAMRLAGLPLLSLPSLPPSLATYALASKLVLDLVSRERILPTLVRRENGLEARWAVSLQAPDDAARAAALAQSMPPSAHAVPTNQGEGNAVWTPDALLRAFLSAMADTLMRVLTPKADAPRPKAAARAAPQRHLVPWESRFLAALEGPERAFVPAGFVERNVGDDIAKWVEPALGSHDKLRACFRLELPESERDPFVLRFLLQSPDDPSLLVTATEVWEADGRHLQKLGRVFRDPEYSLLVSLGQAARLFSPLDAALRDARPEAIPLDAALAFQFIAEGAPTLAQAGFGVILPGELTAAGQRRLRLRMRIGSKSKKAGVVDSVAGFGLDELLTFQWEAAIGDKPLSARELSALARHKAPLVRHRGAWVAVDPRELAEIQRRMAAGPGRMTAREALRAALIGELPQGSMSVAVAAEGAFASIVERIRSGGEAAMSAPNALRAKLRPYQERGLAWLSTMGSLGLGACLADDMGLGKTIQLLAFLLWRASSSPGDARPSLLVAPTSVVGNWEREITRFAPTLRVVRHYGPERAREAAEIPKEPGTLVVTTYGLLRRDGKLFSEVEWATVALDEAQNIKNAASATARAARALSAAHRFALTGTPVENRLAELWSILDFANPGLLGSLEAFRRDYAVPIERYGNEAAAEHLKRLVRPFLLRRVKSDPAIIQDLPPKNEMKVICTLTREQASLYQAVVDEEMRRIASSDGMERRGRVLALLSFLKQICNHPAQYLGEAGPLPRRSGKLSRVTEMLSEARLAGDKALVFTQFREMGERLVAHLEASLGEEVAFLHGGTSKKNRDILVRRFQEDPQGPGVFVLSVKAGGTGLNLTAASHVFHYDRWWNPAVEDQATDRAYRIGQRRAVQVHKLVCAGTVEEKVDRLLEQKRGLASKIVGAGEGWITELGDAELADLFSLSKDAVFGLEDGEDEGVEDTPRPALQKKKHTRGRRTEVRA